MRRGLTGKSGSMRRLERIVVVLVAMAAAAPTVRAEETPSTPLGAARIVLLEARLHRGLSTKTDVQQLLGPPAGSGGAELPGDSIRRDIWYYGNIEVTNEHPELWSNSELVVVATRAQRTLLIFFEGDLYSGYLWISYPAAP
jgi:hypothetical protein